MEALHEREAEVEALSDALAEAASGRGQVVVIEGPGGIGKSRLLAAARELAYALIDLGGALRRDGERTNARPLLSRAHELAEAAGASRAADAARTELRSAGGRVIVATGGGIASLTPSERRVADLAADGRTNREIAQQLFLSPKTVETHLGNVFRKLDISSRQRLADRLRVAA